MTEKEIEQSVNAYECGIGWSLVFDRYQYFICRKCMYGLCGVINSLFIERQLGITQVSQMLKDIEAEGKRVHGKTFDFKHSFVWDSEDSDSRIEFINRMIEHYKQKL